MRIVVLKSIHDVNEMAYRKKYIKKVRNEKRKREKEKDRIKSTYKCNFD